MDYHLYIALFMMTLVVIAGISGRYYEKRDWNGGTCPKCFERYECYDTDSQGGRMYKCSCGYGPDISYSVDKCNICGKLAHDTTCIY